MNDDANDVKQAMIELDITSNENKELTQLMTTQSNDEDIETSVIELVEKLAKTKITLETAKCPFGFSSSKEKQAINKSGEKVRIEFYGNNYHYLTTDVDTGHTVKQLIGQLQTKIRTHGCTRSVIGLEYGGQEMDGTLDKFNLRSGARIDVETV